MDMSDIKDKTKTVSIQRKKPKTDAETLEKIFFFHHSKTLTESSDSLTSAKTSIEKTVSESINS